ncbi:DUF2892 domain-containing protein [Candidatus Bipolaricaulota bacterium]|nr:DUF2892 domain-containing protein [Candidatus Bipolaricaulota bacterium]
MKKNVGRMDSKIRNRLGLVLIIVGVLGLVGLLNTGLVLEIAFLIVGVVAFATGSTRSCGVYSALGVDTLEEEE